MPAPGLRPPEQGEPGTIDVRTEPARYRHWKLAIDGRCATLTLDVSPDGGLRPDYELKLNSYDLAVDIELSDAIQRLRFEHPEVAVVVITSGKDRVFCAGANIRMLGLSSHSHKVDFCKFTNETRLTIEDASEHSGQRYLCAINGTAAGGGYELALATDYLMMVDDGSTTVSLPEVPLLGVLPGTGGLTRLTDKRRVRRDLADFFCTTEEGIRGKRAVDWRLVDEVVPSSRFAARVRERATEMAAESDRPTDVTGVVLEPIERQFDAERITYAHLDARLDRGQSAVDITLHGPEELPPEDRPGLHAAGSSLWSLALARELDDLLLHLRHNEHTLGTLVFRTRGDASLVAAHDRILADPGDDWLANEIGLMWKRTLRRLDLTSRTLIALVEPRSCFVGPLLEIVLAADRSFMLDGEVEGDEAPAPTVRLSASNFGRFPTFTGITRLAARYLDDPEGVSRARQEVNRDLEAEDAGRLRLVTFTPDDIDWEDEVRLAIESRASFSPDALTAMEASLRFPGPETMASRIFGRLTAWQNWVFQRPNAVGDNGALKLYGTGRRASFDKNRV